MNMGVAVVLRWSGAGGLQSDGGGYLPMARLPTCGSDTEMLTGAVLREDVEAMRGLAQSLCMERLLGRCARCRQALAADPTPTGRFRRGTSRRSRAAETSLVR